MRFGRIFSCRREQSSSKTSQSLPPRTQMWISHSHAETSHSGGQMGRDQSLMRRPVAQGGTSHAYGDQSPRWDQSRMRRPVAQGSCIRRPVTNAETSRSEGTRSYLSGLTPGDYGVVTQARTSHVRRCYGCYDIRY
jgi:hypothetical protein